MNACHSALSIALAATIGLASAGAHAQSSPNLIQNGSFEDNTYKASSGYCYGSACGLTGWTLSEIVNGGGVLIGAYSGAWGNPSSLSDAASMVNGDFVVGLQASSGSVSQTLDLSAGSYELSWADANRSNYGFDQSYRVSFNGAQLGSDFSTVLGAGWQSHTLSFTVAQGVTGALRFQGLTTTDGTSFIDNVSLVQTSAVPEPESLALALAGLVVVGQIARRRRAI